MEDRKDILLDENNDLAIQGGDIFVGGSDQQHVSHIIHSAAGEFKEKPQLGLGVVGYLKTNTSEAKFKRDLRVQLNFDGYNKAKIDLRNGFKQLKIKI